MTRTALRQKHLERDWGSSILICGSMNGTTVSFSEGRALTLMLELSEIERVNSPWNR